VTKLTTDREIKLEFAIKPRSNYKFKSQITEHKTKVRKEKRRERRLS